MPSNNQAEAAAILRQKMSHQTASVEIRQRRRLFSSAVENLVSAADSFQIDQPISRMKLAVRICHFTRTTQDVGITDWLQQFLYHSFQLIDAIHLARVQLKQPDAAEKLAGIAELMLVAATGLMQALKIRQQQLNTLRETTQLALDALECRHK